MFLDSVQISIFPFACLILPPLSVHHQLSCFPYLLFTVVIDLLGSIIPALNFLYRMARLAHSFLLSVLPKLPILIIIGVSWGLKPLGSLIWTQSNKTARFREHRDTEEAKANEARGLVWRWWVTDEEWEVMATNSWTRSLSSMCLSSLAKVPTGDWYQTEPQRDCVPRTWACG